MNIAIPGSLWEDKTFGFFNSVNLNPLYAVRYWNKCGLILLGSLCWEEVSHPNAQRLFLIFLILKAISIFSAGMCPLIRLHKQIWEILSHTSAFLFPSQAQGGARLPSGRLWGVLSVPIWCSVETAAGFTYTLCCLHELLSRALGSGVLLPACFTTCPFHLPCSSRE